MLKGQEISNSPLMSNAPLNVDSMLIILAKFNSLNGVDYMIACIAGLYNIQITSTYAIELRAMLFALKAMYVVQNPHQISLHAELLCLLLNQGYMLYKNSASRATCMKYNAHSDINSSLGNLPASFPSNHPVSSPANPPPCSPVPYSSLSEGLHSQSCWLPLPSLASALGSERDTFRSML